ncbi:LAQU0S39e00100g1_1 [Lachancea quebecensis]|uniref:LAQU0S39e00100g1_1 n=1 Tax=Lachancea quebecensis TaxID=1654605 RepID=A0A0P1KYM5_9SACH|nr:LAQU0S39e00100g1_1 [Lachancea quebecensis]
MIEAKPRLSMNSKTAAASIEISKHKRDGLNVATNHDTESTTESNAGFEPGSEFLKVKEMEIINSTCSGRLEKAFLLASAFLCGFGYYMDFITRSVYTGYATSSYDEHALLSTVQVINSVVSIGAQIIFARLSDFYGRLQLFSTGTVLYIVGTIIQSQARDIRTYAVGAVFYNSGYVGVSLLLILVLSDMSSSKWRLFYQFAASWPCIIICWVSGDVVQAANPAKNWPLDIGMWAFVFPLSALPFVSFLLYATRQASKTVEWKEIQDEKETHKTSVAHWIQYIVIRLDVVGTILITASLGCILVPLTLAGGVSNDWKKVGIIAALVVGVVLFVVFLAWDIKFARNAVLPFKLMKDRGVWASLVAAFLEKMIYAMISDYLYPVLLVSVNESSKSATRIVWLPTFAACTGSIFFGLLVARTKRLKPYSICGVCLWVISIGIFYHYRGGASSHGGIIGASIVLGIGSAIFTQSLIVNLQTMTSHKNMASITGLYFMFAQVGSATGASISGAIWTQTMYKQLEKQFKNSNLAMIAFASPYEFIASYSWGTPERTQMIYAYRYVQKQTMLVSLILTAPLLVFVLFTKDIKLGDTLAGETIQSDQDPMLTWVRNKFKKLKAMWKWTS